MYLWRNSYREKKLAEAKSFSHTTRYLICTAKLRNEVAILYLLKGKLLVAVGIADLTPQSETNTGNE